MPYFNVDDLDISPSDFVDSCSRREINELIEILIEDGYLTDNDVNSEIKKNNKSYLDKIYDECLFKLSISKHRLTNEEEEIIKKIADRL
jgi:hypothetical protein